MSSSHGKGGHCRGEEGGCTSHAGKDAGVSRDSVD